jgi:hypothetical protein
MPGGAMGPDAPKSQGISARAARTLAMISTGAAAILERPPAFLPRSVVPETVVIAAPQPSAQPSAARSGIVAQQVAPRYRGSIET